MAGECGVTPAGTPPFTMVKLSRTVPVMSMKRASSRLPTISSTMEPITLIEDTMQGMAETGSNCDELPATA